MTWLDLGNGWRNLYLLSCVLQAGALGTLFAARHWFAKKSRVACFLTGAAATPLVQYLWTLLLALVWPNAPKLVYIGVLPVLAALCLLVLVLRRIRRLPSLVARGWRFALRVCHFEKPALIALCFALCIIILIAPVCVRFCSSMNSLQGGDIGEYMALAQRYCDDRDIGNLLEKEETVGHFRGHSHFPSFELFMSYGLFHTGGDSYGYPYDKPAFAGMGMLTFYMVAAYLALLLLLCRERKAYVLLGVVLLNLVPNLYDSVAAAPRDTWRILALLLSVSVFAGMEPRGSLWRYLGRLALSFAVCFTAMSTHVVCFVVLPFIVAAWVVWRWLQSLMRRDHSAGRTLLGSLGIALAGAGGTLLAFMGNIWCYLKWGEMSPWRIMTTYTSAPWYSMYMDIEYKLEETTTHLNFWQSMNDILLSYATPIGIWGLRLAVIALVGAIVWLVLRQMGLKKQEQTLLIASKASATDGPTAVHLTAREDGATQTASHLIYAALLTLFTLAPMTGLLDSPLYSFSGSFLKLPRYTLQWFMLAPVMICAALSALEDLWPAICHRLARRHQQWIERHDLSGKLRHACKAAPAYLCALLCVLGTVQGTKQTGYADSFYRYSRQVMESESILLDNGYRERYQLLSAVAAAVPDDQAILITRSGYQYPLHGRGYVLLSNPIVPILNMPYAEIEGELTRLNVAMLATEPRFWDDRYFPLTTLHQYLQTLPPEQVVETEQMRLYLLDPSLVPVAQAALEESSTGLDHQ